MKLNIIKEYYNGEIRQTVLWVMIMIKEGAKGFTSQISRKVLLLENVNHFAEAVIRH